MSATPLTHQAELAAGEADLLASLGQSEEWARQPSGLPGWVRSHVVAHLVGNAIGMINLVAWARTGTETPMYPSMQARAAEIEERSKASLSELRTDLEHYSQQFQDECRDLVEPLPSHSLRLGSGAPVQAWQLPMTRLREVEIHRVDLAAGYRPDDWSERFTLRTIDQVLPVMRSKGLPVDLLRAADSGRVWEAAETGPSLFGTEANLLAWLIGRPHEGLTLSSGAPVPTAPPWV